MDELFDINIHIEEQIKWKKKNSPSTNSRF
jgi:hypothetical protein